MNEKSKNQIYQLEFLKKQKIEEIFGLSEESKKKKNIDFKRLKKLIFFFMLIFISFTIFFLWKKYIEFQKYVENTRESIILAEKYKEEQSVKEEEERKKQEGLEEERLRKEKELKDLKKLSFETINNLPDEKKEVMLNIIPSGNPLNGEIDIMKAFGIKSQSASNQKKLHQGIDLRLTVGNDVMSTAIGKVSYAGKKEGYGYVVVVDHMYGFQTAYAYLDKVYVKFGEIVGKGKVIALGGKSSISAEPHLYYEVRYKGLPINPQNFIEWNKKQFNIVFENERSVPWDYFLTIMGKN
ncbi:MAG: M23 family metallopeptidase [Fusobacterium sp.]|uniref:M23 family metallopeptidase n=1 Tax=Fusobacterium sp. TaxID=68766 RepID=UPI0026DD1DB0|nr:M23 family metallopeptidase [Fusobacterium sp.]MDO4689865.1 M23 family metallopeptidase [Fusobacterium sp.]